MHRLFALATLMLAFATPVQAAPQSSGDATKAPDKLTLLLDWFVNPDHAPIVIAKEKGFFAKEGLDVDIVEPSDPSMPPRLVAAGKGDIAVSYETTLHSQVEENLPVMRIGTLISTPLNSLIVLANGPIKTLADVKGKRIGYSVTGFEDAMLGQMLESVGLTTKDIDLINVNFSLTPSLLAGQVDGFIGGYRNFELTQMELAGKKGRAFYPEEHGVPPYDELIYIVRKGNENDPRFPRFLKAVEEATIYLENHPDEAWQAFIKAYPNLNDELNHRAWNDTLRRFANRPAALDAGRYQRFADFMHERGLIKKDVPVSDYAVELR